MRTLSTLSPVAVELLQSDRTPKALVVEATSAFEGSTDVCYGPDDKLQAEEPSARDESAQDWNHDDESSNNSSVHAPVPLDSSADPPIVVAATDPAFETNGHSVPSDINRFRLSQNFGASAPVKKLITTVQVRKPHNQEFVRASPDLTFDALTYLWKDDNNRPFLVEPALVPQFPQGLRPTLIVGAINRQNVFFFWPLFLKQGDESWNDWHRSAYESMVEARKNWVRVESNRALGAYETSVALAADLPEPTWPNLSLEELLLIAFRDYIIDRVDHIILKKLRGEA